MFPRLSKIEYRILDLLRGGGEMYGLEMVKASAGDLKRGTIYVTLTRMKEKGYVNAETEKEPKHSGLPRQKYRISGHGQNVLNAVDAAQAHISGGEINV